MLLINYDIIGKEFTVATLCSLHNSNICLIQKPFNTKKSTYLYLAS